MSAAEERARALLARALDRDLDEVAVYDHLLAPEHFTEGRFGAPIISEALASFECQLEATHEGGDHLIIVGRVLDMRRRDGGEPLLFYSGAYRALD